MGTAAGDTMWPNSRGDDVTEQDSVRRECLDHVLILGERHLQRVLSEYVAHFNGGRPHQGIGQATPETPPGPQGNNAGPVRAVPVLGGLHHAYERVA